MRCELMLLARGLPAGVLAFSGDKLSNVLANMGRGNNDRSPPNEIPALYGLVEPRGVVRKAVSHRYTARILEYSHIVPP